MDMFIQEMGKVLFGWWWFCRDGQTKAAERGDRFVLPTLIALGLGCIGALLLWRWW